MDGHVVCSGTSISPRQSADYDRDSRVMSEPQLARDLLYHKGLQTFTFARIYVNNKRRQCDPGGVGR